jgi:hypothetical protein
MLGIATLYALFGIILQKKKRPTSKSTTQHKMYGLSSQFQQFNLVVWIRVARFFLVHDTKIEKMYPIKTKHTKWLYNIPMSVK